MRVERATPWGGDQASGTEVTVRSRLRYTWRASAYLMLGAAAGCSPGSSSPACWW